MPAPPAARATRVARWRYVLPNAITCFSLLLGLASIVNAFEGDYLEAAWLVVMCVLLDKADGSVARLLKATSKIGLQLDSFSDFIAFGVAPACLVFARLLNDPTGAGDIWADGVARWVLHALLAAWVLLACIRLAKFNVLDGTLPSDGPKVFYGLPTTFAGGTLVVLYIIGVNHDFEGLVRWLPVVGVAFGALMVSNLPLPKLVARKFMPLNIFQLVVALIGYACGIGRFWPEFILGAVIVYASFGFGWGFIHRRELMPRRVEQLDPYPQ